MAMTWTNLIFAFVILVALGALSSRIYEVVRTCMQKPFRPGW